MRPKIGDIFVYIFIVVLVGLSFLGLKAMGTHKGKAVVRIEVDGKLVETFEMPDLKDTGAFREIPVDMNEDEFNVVRISSKGIDISDANCPDRLCVYSPAIKTPGQSIICIPHKLIVRITGETPKDGDVDDTAS
ncbi:MAG: NusG domain II-containing protein [Clostridiales bacterium]|nr:NusG domain II-containing protein [Clostridiales bacterium]